MSFEQGRGFRLVRLVGLNQVDSAKLVIGLE